MTDCLVADRDIEFLLFDWLRIDRDGHVDRDTCRAVLGLATNVARDLFLPHYRASDVIEPRWEDGQVKLLPEIVHALREYAKLGLCGLGFPEDLGGMNLPQTVGMACHAILSSANISATGYTMLTAANARLLLECASREQIAHFALPLIEGRWFGTMCLSEPQAGSGLGDIRCRAIAQDADELGRRYLLSGTKMWISAGEHEITENIVHLVLAKVPRADGTLPPGTKGISLFIVPKILPGGDRNDIAVAGLNHKMGYRATVNCLLNFGEQGGALGWLVGEEGDGLRQMFKMMNESRIAVGTGAAALAIRSHRHAVQYAHERIQGRVPGQDGGEPVAIIRHPDIRRMLLQQKSYAEGALALCLYCASLSDEDSAEAGILLGLLTPVTKSWPSEFGLVVNDTAIQVHGGYGYTRDFPVEQLWRDNRLNPIHEGTTGIQAIDLLERKILKAEPRELALLEQRIRLAVARSELAEASYLLAVLDRSKEVIALMAQRPALARLQDATQFLRAFGHMIVGWMWLELAASAAGQADPLFREGKILAARYFCDFELPQAMGWLDSIARGNDLIVRTPEAIF